MQRLKRCDQFAEKKRKKERKKEWTALDGFCSKTVDVTPIVKPGISSSHTQKVFLAYLIFFSNYCFDSFPLIVSYMQGSSTFEVCEKSLYSQYSQYFVN